jgi:pectate lyase
LPGGTGGVGGAGGATGSAGGLAGASATGGGGATGDAGGSLGGASGGAESGGSAGGTDGQAGSGAAAGTSGTGGSAGGSSGGKGVVGTPIGFATLNGGTTGGGAAQPVTVTSYAELKAAAESGSAAVILVSGTIENGPNGGVIAVKSNKSIVGVGNNALLNGVGLDINNSNNIIIQNLRITLMGVTTRTDTPNVYSSTGDEGMPQILVNEGDAIGIRGSSKNIWIDHCEIYSEDPNTQTNRDLYDGLIDVKNETGFITISWNYFHDQHKGGLVGASDSDIFADRKITFHHNHYNKVKLRVPMYRGSTGHFFNNYVVGAQDATEIRADTCVRVEKNYYEALHYSIYTTSDSEGSTQRIDNVEVMRTERAYPPSCTADIPYSYSNVLIDTTTDVKTLVPAGAGVGKI